jgi:16S rRNA (guanine527-N7)-methyltransferase
MFHVEHDLFVKVLVEAASAYGLALQPHHLAALTLHYHELQKWRRKVNLTGLRDPRDIAIKHVLDSLLFRLALQEPSLGSLLDVGSGAGFPGLPLKVLAPDLYVTLLEPNQKKVAFLRHVIGKIGLEHIAVVSMNIREFSRSESNHGRFTYLTVRAVALSTVLPFVKKLLSPQGRAAVSLGGKLPFDPAPYGLKIARECPYSLPDQLGQRVVTVLEPLGGV